MIIKNTKKERKSIRKYVLFAVFGIMALSSVFMTVETATSSVEVTKLREKESELSLEKRNLEGSLTESLSMNDLETKSADMGFSKPTSLVYVSKSQDVVAQLP